MAARVNDPRQTFVCCFKVLFIFLEVEVYFSLLWPLLFKLVVCCFIYLLFFFVVCIFEIGDVNHKAIPLNASMVCLVLLDSIITCSQQG